METPMEEIKEKLMKIAAFGIGMDEIENFLEVVEEYGDKRYNQGLFDESITQSFKD